MTHAALKQPQPPTAASEWKLVDATMRRHAWSPHALIETLHTAQELFGYLDKRTLAYVAAWLRVPLSRAYGVATFYHLFRTQPRAQHVCVVCTGTACHIRGAGALRARLEERLGVSLDAADGSGRVSLISAHCVALCGLAPVILLDDDVVAQANAETIGSRVEGWGAP